MRIFRVILISLAIVLAASCGASSSKAADPATTAPASSTTVPKARAAYIVAANALCRTMNAKVAKLARQRVSATNEAALTDQAAGILADTLRRLRRLPVPAGDEAAVRAMYAKIDVVVADAPKLSAALRANDQAAGQRVQARLQDASNLANAALKQYGLSVCGS